jgi:hypothetical protein
MTTAQASATGTRVEREEWAETLLDRLTPAMSALGVIFVLVVLGEQLARSGSPLSTALTIAGWLLWAVFVMEFVARLVVAPDTGRFWQRNWWQVAFLVLPFLRVLRLIRAVRLLRTGRVLSSTVRGSRSAHSLLGGRLGWFGAVGAITVLGAEPAALPVQRLQPLRPRPARRCARGDHRRATPTERRLRRRPRGGARDLLRDRLRQLRGRSRRLLPRPANSGPRRDHRGSSGAAVDRWSR